MQIASTIDCENVKGRDKKYNIIYLKEMNVIFWYS